MLTHGNLLANLLPLEHEVAKYLKWERFVHPVRFLNLVPLSHVFGQMMVCLFLNSWVASSLSGQFKSRLDCRAHAQEPNIRHCPRSAFDDFVATLDRRSDLLGVVPSDKNMSF